MQFKPFWDQLADLGIELPEPYKILAKETPKGQQQQQLSGPGRWCKAGETITIGEYQLPGMIYVGESLPSVENYRGTEPALINPTAYMGRKPDHEGKNVPYNPSYHKLNGDQRAAYLHWLSTGRSTKGVCVRYVTLFFYGLERRVFHDLFKQPKSDERDRELKEIAQELERLQSIHKTHDRFNYYGGSFQDNAAQAVRLIRLMLDPHSVIAIDPFKAQESDLKLLIGQTVAQGRPISAFLGLAYCWSVLGVNVPSVAQQFPQVFRQVFEHNYQQRFGEGVVIKPGKMKFRVPYNPLNGSFGNRTQTIPLDSIPDISRQTGQLEPIIGLVRESRYALDSYSRYLSQNPQDADSPKALGQLPVSVLSTWKSAGIDRVKTWLSEQFTSAKIRHQIILAQDILPLWTGKKGPHITKSELKSMGNLLEALGYGLEPDGRQVQIDVPAETQIVLYRLGADRPTQPSRAYKAATLLVHLALAVASGEAPASEIEQQAILAHIPTFPGLGPTEQAKLIAHLYYLQAPTITRLAARLEFLTGSKSELGQFLITVAAADGPLSPTEIKQLEKAYKLLSLESQTLYSDIHNLGNSQPNPQKTTKKTKPDKLDMATVHAKIAESKEISSLLADIFTEDAPAVKTPAKTKAKAKTTAKTYANLDAKHSALLQHLAQSDQWDRTDLLPVAETLGLLLDGALEVINEAAFDLCDEPVLEGHDSIEIDRTVMEQLLT
jgi:TerB N-terminal domain/TerB-C domain